MTVMNIRVPSAEDFYDRNTLLRSRIWGLNIERVVRYLFWGAVTLCAGFLMLATMYQMGVQAGEAVNTTIIQGPRYCGPGILT